MFGRVITISNSVRKLQKSLTNDKGFREGYKSNIAMAFKDEAERFKEENNQTHLSRADIHTIAHNAADNFLTLFCKK